jgi:glycosyltransferase involved in cell wall biosynthesis
VTSAAAPTISVIVPVYNMGRYLTDAVASIEAQGFERVEVVVVDDGSTDETPEVIASLGERVVAVRQPNRGAAAARNVGIEMASGELLAFLYADDLWPAGKVARQLERLEREPELDVVLGRIQYVAIEGGEAPDIEFEDFDAQTLTHVHLGSGLYRRRAFELIGTFDESLRLSEDLDWFLRAREARLRVAIIPEITLVYRLHGTNTSRGSELRESQTLQALKKSLDRRRAAGIDGDLAAWSSLDERVPDSPTVSVVIPAFEAASYLRQAVHSALQQTHKPLEVIVVDDGSHDQTSSVARRFGSRVTVIRQAHAGIGAARNAGIREAGGELLALLDADDLWDRDKLARQVQILELDPTIDLVFGGVEQFVSPELERADTPASRASSSPGRHASAVLMRATVVERVGIQREDLELGEFIDWFDRALAAGCRVGEVDGVVVRRRIHTSNTGIRLQSARGDYARMLKDVLDRRRAAEGGRQ